VAGRPNPLADRKVRCTEISQDRKGGTSGMFAEANTTHCWIA